MRVVLTGGGTGGHIYPALAIGQAIKKEWPEAELLFIGTKKGLESRIVPEAGIPFVAVDVVGWQRRFSPQALVAGYKALRALRQSSRIIRNFSPRLVVGTGGYVCLPVVWAASRQRIPTVIHEQNSLPGLTNKFLSRLVDRVMLTFPDSARFFSAQVQSKLRVTGLPVRPAIMQTKREAGLKFFGLSPEKATILGVGGSRGAKSLNEAMLAVCGRLAGDKRVQIIHLTGAAGYEEFLGGLASQGIDVSNCGNIILRPYLHEMEYALACADICVARAGAAFLAEMTARGIPGILIPYPHAAENHQYYNAISLAQRGAAIVLEDNDLNGAVLLDKITELLTDDKKRGEMSHNSLQAGQPDAVRKILDHINKLLNGKD